MRIGLTSGDPAGIGFEVIFKALPPLLSEAQWVLFSHPADLRANRERFGSTLGPFDEVDAHSPGLRFQAIGEEGAAAGWGVSSAETGRRAVAALETAGRWALDGRVDGIVTAPLGKLFAGSGFRGQTEFLAEQAGVRRAAMSFFAPTFKVVLATTHVALAQVPSLLSVPLYLDLLRLIDRELGGDGPGHPRIGVAALNPHAGEGGMFGNEDADTLAPAVERAREEGLVVSGPHPADSLYLQAHRGRFDVILAPYHDQALIPVKLIAPGAATNVTLGLPYVRTSPDHGTALDIAGRGLADPESMRAACRLAIELISRHRRSQPGVSSGSVGTTRRSANGDREP